MALYYFDLRDGDELIADEEGLELRDIRAVQQEATRALVDLAGDSMQNINGVQVKFHFDISRKQ